MGVIGIWWRGCLWTPQTDFCLLRRSLALAHLTPTGCTFKAAWFFLVLGWFPAEHPLSSNRIPNAASLPSLARLSSVDPGYCFQSYPRAFLFPACFCPFPDLSAHSHLFPPLGCHFVNRKRGWKQTRPSGVSSDQSHPSQ